MHLFILCKQTIVATSFFTQQLKQLSFPESMSELKRFVDLLENVKQTSDQIKPRLTYSDHHHTMFMEERKEIIRAKREV